MLAHQYQIWLQGGWGHEWNPDDPIEKRYVGITAVAKRDKESTFEVFNELVAMRLGQLIGLPIPVGMVLNKDNTFYFASCHILAAGGELPKADLERFAKEKPIEACGVLVFDAWIANTDRHDENLWYDYYADRYFLIDHGRALLDGSGLTHLRSRADDLALRTDPPCLAPHIRSFHAFEFWRQQITALSEAAIRTTAIEAATVGVDQTLALECANWLIKRRRELPQLFRKNTSIFSRLQPSVLDPFGGPDVLFPQYCI